jgi:hypothetical protein
LKNYHAMAPSHLVGLNIVHPPVEQPSGLSDTQDLLSAPPYADLSAQLDFWTNLNFHDEPASTAASNEDERKFRTRELLKERERSEEIEEKTQDAPQQQTPVPSQQPAQPSFDINSFLVGIGIDPYHLPPAQSSLMTNLPTLAQILAAQQQIALSTPTHLPHAAAFPQMTSSSSSAAAEAPPPSKRARTRKSSVSTIDSPEDIAAAPSPASPAADGPPARPLSPNSAAEDKRRRNTAASARFRLKKKEREAALEQRAKELENKVNELERECEGLRRENGWLKGLVVGVTGAGAAPSLPPSLAGPIGGIGGGSGSGVGSKRGREDDRRA